MTPTLDPLEPWLISDQEWEFLVPETPEKLREPVDKPVDNSDDS